MSERMYFGITEGGDAGIDFNWVKALDEDTSLIGSIIITKCLNAEMFEALLKHKSKIILHVSVTGYAGTVVEPNTPSMNDIYRCAQSLLDKGFPKSHMVLRIDPIIPTKKGLRNATKVYHQFFNIADRVRVSIIDMYATTRKRFQSVGLPCPYGENFQASPEQIRMVDDMLKQWKQEHPSISIEACAEKDLLVPEHCGCVSKKDYDILGIPMKDVPKRASQRSSCLCLGAKKEILGGKTRCPNQCLYCYWHDDPNVNASEILLQPYLQNTDSGC